MQYSKLFKCLERAVLVTVYGTAHRKELLKLFDQIRMYSNFGLPYVAIFTHLPKKK